MASIFHFVNQHIPYMYLRCQQIITSSNFIPDKRLGICYMNGPLYGRKGMCRGKLADGVSRATCCCTQGNGWGEVPGFCENCPNNGTSKYHMHGLQGSGWIEQLVKPKI